MSKHSIFSVLLRPIISEKSNKMRETGGVYTFQIRLDASKDDVKKAVSEIFNVKAATVKTITQKGKVRRRGLRVSEPKTKKKAFVTLAEGQKINIFEVQ